VVYQSIALRRTLDVRSNGWLVDESLLVVPSIFPGPPTQKHDDSLEKGSNDGYDERYCTVETRWRCLPEYDDRHTGNLPMHKSLIYVCRRFCLGKARMNRRKD
jgi:hypothetical protein